MNQADKREQLTQFLRTEGIVNFTGLECVTLKRAGIVVDVPPEEWWPRIIPAFIIAEMLRELLGFPLAIGNGYRPAAINKRVGGAKRSQHPQFRALDIDLVRGHNGREEQEALYEEAGRLYLHLGDEYKMGFGIYRQYRGKRVHIDCGGRKRATCWSGPKGAVWPNKNRYVKELLNELR